MESSTLVIGIGLMALIAIGLGGAAFILITVDDESAQVPPVGSNVAEPDGIVIAGPLPGTVVVPGEPLDVTVKPTGEFVPVRVLVTSDYDAHIVEQEPFTVTLEIPLQALGPITLSANAFDAEDNLAQAEEVVIIAETEARLIDISVSPDTVYLVDSAPSEQLTVIGMYADGVERDITTPTFGTLYESLDPEVATVDEHGLVTAVSQGRTSAVVRNGDLEAVSNVVVR